MHVFVTFICLNDKNKTNVTIEFYSYKYPLKCVSYCENANFDALENILFQINLWIWKIFWSPSALSPLADLGDNLTIFSD